MNHHPVEEENDQEDDVKKVFPFANSWNTIYAIVLGELVLLIILFYLFSNAYS
ncbi:MAG: hypothetical protein R3B93_22525 [Bacteroidia bacterium]|nr:hypothetical protein [Bacteroidota bacterium]